jgi:hypothetical protein
LWDLGGSGRGPERWVDVERVRRGGAAVAEEWSCTPPPDMEKSMLGRGLPKGGVRTGVDDIAREGGGIDVSWICRSC